ncbi:tetratricopeptide repeat protein [Roseiarcaceae bacterium H3SJ34-1]|uniref:tetratricopeptide repeat protein n=1 Tax=Terripilifer ovatus TaxID=3032367 RepID=UPI003AB9305C|nr:tetratricopeptide repeat protein [Roseiarcaceae bacterium H3SJ34-1]
MSDVLAHPDFAASNRLSAFLKFIVTETLEGRADRLKAFSIAVTVYGRDETFDPQANSIVRVEATRLRRMLDRYFRDEGKDAPVEIRIPKGRYVPEFVRRGETDSRRAAAGAAPETPRPPPPRPRSRLRLALMALVPVALIAGGVLGWLYFDGPDSKPAPLKAAEVELNDVQDMFRSTEPTIAVVVRETANPVLQRLASRIKDAIEHELERADDVSIIERIGDGATQIDYRVDLGVEAAGENLASLRVRVTHVASGELIWSRNLRDLSLDPQALVQDRRPSDIGLAISRPHGLIFSDFRIRARQQTGAKSPYFCIIKSFDYFQDPTIASYKDALACLDQALAVRPEYANAVALKSMILSDEYVNRLNGVDSNHTLDEAFATARRAIALDPQHTRPYYALAMAQFLAQDYEGCKESLRHAVELNPSAAYAVARQGAVLVLRGEIDKGSEILNAAILENEVLRDSYAFYFFLVALVHDDRVGIQNWGRAAAATQYPQTMLASIIAADQRGDLATKNEWVEQLGKRFPYFANDIKGGLDRMGMSDPLSERLLGDLADAGVNVGIAEPPKN